ncbi:hypothetical protein Q9R46_14695 [Paenibacillus sp. RRE4]|uniref:hypothetical protein n=1 Tax=Paenibacillus sp. RRE4 TaxID=2962587 RepID=UPI00288258D7|nr:hypothetical protein [Paenibacillus sp. RRE4]MDT0123907.1 hypothetical protein [Paenibacillus sp. RRE4]
MVQVRITKRLEHFYHLVGRPDIQVFAYAECADGNVYYQHTDGWGELEWQPVREFYGDFERIRD